MASTNSAAATDTRTPVQKVFETTELLEMILGNLDYESLKAARCVCTDFDDTSPASNKCKTILFRSAQPDTFIRETRMVTGTCQMCEKDAEGCLNPRFWTHLLDHVSMDQCDGKWGGLYAELELPGYPSGDFMPDSRIEINIAEDDTKITFYRTGYESNALCFDETNPWHDDLTVDTTQPWCAEYLAYPETNTIRLCIDFRLDYASINIFDDPQPVEWLGISFGTMASCVDIKPCNIGNMLAIANAMYRVARGLFQASYHRTFDLDETKKVLSDNGLDNSLTSLILAGMAMRVEVTPPEDS